MAAGHPYHFYNPEESKAGEIEIFSVNGITKPLTKGIPRAPSLAGNQVRYKKNYFYQMSNALDIIEPQ